jgi:hypothetical protein
MNMYENISFKDNVGASLQSPLRGAMSFWEVASIPDDCCKQEEYVNALYKVWPD